jgi:hypothetical protein
MSDAPKSGLTRGEIIVAPNNPGAYIMRPFREKVCAILTAFLKQRIIAIVTPADGSVPIQVEAEIHMASNGMVATLDLTAVAGLGGGTGGGTGGGGWNWLGLYNPVTTYAQNDVVQLGSGTAAGMYLSILSPNTNAPDSGIGWVQISTSAGTWL